MLARGIKRQNEGLPVRGEGIRDRLKNVFVNVGGVLLKKGTKHVAEQLKKSKNPVAQVTGHVIDVTGHGVGTAMQEQRGEEAMDTRPAVVLNNKKEPVAVEAPAPPVPTPSEPNLAKPPPVNRASTKAKSEDIQAGNPTIQPVPSQPVSIPEQVESQKKKAGRRKRKRGKGRTVCSKRIKSLFS